MKSIFSVLFFLGAFAALTVPAVAQDEASFEKGLKSVERRMSKGQWEKAGKELKDLLKEHERADYVYIEKPRVLANMERIALFSVHAPPTADEVLAAKVKKYDAESGEIEMTLYGEDLSDLMQSGDAFTMPVAFRDDYTLSMSGPKYPGSEGVTVVVGFDSDQMHRFFFGSVGYQPSVSLSENGEREKLVESAEKEMMDSGEPFTLSVEVKKKKISTKANKKRMFSVKRSDTDWGRAAFYGLADYEREGLEITIKGALEPAWIAGKIDEQMQDKREAFEETYDAHRELPEWLFDDSQALGAGGEEAESAGGLRGRAGAKNNGSRKPSSDQVFRAYPGAALGAAGERSFAEIRRSYYQDDFDFAALMEKVQEAEDAEDIHEASASLLRMEIHLLYGQIEEAADYAAKMVALDASHQPSVLNHANLLIRLRDYETSRELLEQAQKDWPNAVEVVEATMWLEIMTQHLEEAQDLVQNAQRRGIRGKEIDRLRARIDKAISGPIWQKTYRFQSTHYDIQSDISEAICKEAANLLESAYTSYSVHLKRIRGLEKNKFRVFLFSGEASYQRYAEDSLGSEAENTAGLFSPWLKQLLIWNVPQREMMLRTVVHEGFHQYLDLVAPEAPRWFNEGMAEYMELYETVDGRFTEGQVNHDHIALLQEKGVMPLRDFLRMPTAFFYQGDVGRNYAQGWAVIHFLRNGGNDKEKMFQELFEGFSNSPSIDRVIDEVFAGVDMELFEQEFLDHMNGLE